MEHLKELALPRTVEEFWEKKSQYGARAQVIAGGTEIVSEPPEGVECLIDIRHLASHTIVECGDSIEIGAAVTMEELTSSKLASEIADGMLCEATRQGWPLPVRSAATIGGNVAGGDPFADTPPVLLALGAELVLETEHGSKSVLAEDFFLDYRRTAAHNAVLMSIRIPKSVVKAQGAFVKVAPTAVDKAMVNLGVCADIADGHCRSFRLAVGAVTRVPHRIRIVEELMTSSRLSPELLEEAADQVVQNVEPMLDMRASVEHRRSLLAAVFKRAVRSLALEAS